MRVFPKVQRFPMMRCSICIAAMWVVLSIAPLSPAAPISPGQLEGATFTGSLNAATVVLQRQFHVQVDVAWEALAEAGVNDNTQVQEMSRKLLDDALRAVLHASGAGTC